MSNSSNAVLGILAGTAIGATLGILFAPDKGENTRKRIAEEAIATKDQITGTTLELKEKIAHSFSANSGTLEDQIENVVSNFSHKTEDVITTLEQKLKDLKAKNKQFQKTSLS